MPGFGCDLEWDERVLDPPCSHQSMSQIKGVVSLKFDQPQRGPSGVLPSSISGRKDLIVLSNFENSQLRPELVHLNVCHTLLQW